MAVTAKNTKIELPDGTRVPHEGKVRFGMSNLAFARAEDPQGLWFDTGRVKSRLAETSQTIRLPKDILTDSIRCALGMADTSVLSQPQVEEAPPAFTQMPLSEWFGGIIETGGPGFILFNGILSTADMPNDRDDMMLREDLVETAKTAVWRHIDLYHERSQIVGHILDVALATKNPGGQYDVLLGATEAEEVKDVQPLHLAILGVLYGYLFPDLEKDMRSQFSGLSWEVFFQDFEVASIKDGQPQILEDRHAFSYLKSLNGSGVYSNERVYRVLRDCVMLGAGLVPNPADVRAHVARFQAHELTAQDSAQATEGDSSMAKKKKKAGTEEAPLQTGVSDSVSADLAEAASVGEPETGAPAESQESQEPAEEAQPETAEASTEPTSEPEAQEEATASEEETSPEETPEPETAQANTEEEEEAPDNDTTESVEEPEEGDAEEPNTAVADDEQSQDVEAENEALRQRVSELQARLNSVEQERIRTERRETLARSLEISDADAEEIVSTLDNLLLDDAAFEKAFSAMRILHVALASRETPEAPSEPEQATSPEEEPEATPSPTPQQETQASATEPTSPAETEDSEEETGQVLDTAQAIASADRENAAPHLPPEEPQQPMREEFEGLIAQVLRN